MSIFLQSGAGGARKMSKLEVLFCREIVYESVNVNMTMNSESEWRYERQYSRYTMSGSYCRYYSHRVIVVTTVVTTVATDYRITMHAIFFSLTDAWCCAPVFLNRMHFAHRVGMSLCVSSIYRNCCI